MKRITAFFLMMFSVLFMFTVSYAKTAVESIMGNDDSYIILATITGVQDSVFELSKEYVISPKESDLPAIISVDKFRYSYCSEHAESYNNPQIGDNIIVNLTYSDGKYYIENGAYKVDTVSYKTLKVLIPIEMKGQDCSAELLALAYYIRSDGTKTDYKYEGSKAYALPQTIINDYENEYVSYYSNSNNISDDVIKDMTLEDLLANKIWIPIVTVLTLLIALGSGVICIINRNIIKKQ